jgi:dihydropyrimidinase
VLIRGATLVDPEGGPEGQVGPGALLVRGPTIAAVLPADAAAPAGVPVLDASGLHLFPGLVEPHAHLGYGGADMAGHFETETASAVLGGVTTLLNVYRQYGRPAAPYDELGDALRACAARSRIDFGIHLALLLPDHVASIARHAAEHGVRSFKFYLAYRGPDARQIGMTNELDDGLLAEALGGIARLPGGIACFHCENTEVINRVAARLQAAGAQGLRAWASSRPAHAEAESVHRAAALAGAAGCPAYLLHVSGARALEEARRHRARGARVHVETCPHYLTLAADAPLGSRAKVNPPIRDAADAESLWEGIARGDVDTVGTDHCPVPLARKVEDIWEAAPGFPGMATALPLLVTEGHIRRGLPLPVIAKLMALNPSRLFGLFPRKGTLRPGADADLVLADLGTVRPVEAARLGSVSDVSLWEGRPLAGWPVVTMVRGRVVMERGRVVGEPGWGRYLGRPAGAGRTLGVPGREVSGVSARPRAPGRLID